MNFSLKAATLKKNKKYTNATIIWDYLFILFRCLLCCEAALVFAVKLFVCSMKRVTLSVKFFSILLSKNKFTLSINQTNLKLPKFSYSYSLTVS